MISKRLLFASVCLAVLIVAVGAYGYSLYGRVSSLGSQLEDLQSEINLLRHLIYSINPGKTFSFFWQGPTAEKFNVTTFWMNITFERTNETHLTITVEINDLTHRDYYVGVVFDMGHDGELDGDWGWKYRPYEHPWWGYSKTKAILGDYINGQRFFNLTTLGIVPSAHTCTFDSQLGYTFVIPVDLQELELINDLIHVEYNDVAVEFSFGMELIA